MFGGISRHFFRHVSISKSEGNPIYPRGRTCHAAEEAVNVNYFISIYDFEVQEIGFKSNDCMKESKSVKTSPSSLMFSSIAAIVSSLA